MKKSYKRISLYLIGMIVLAAGLTLNSKVTLGVSPILSLPYAVSEMLQFNFSDAVFVWYCLFIVLQVLVHLHLKKEKTVFISDVAQILISLLFTRIMNIFASFIPVFETECQGFTSTIWLRMIMLALAIMLTGIGAALTLSMHLIPNPGDGIVATLSELLDKKVGTCKNIVDISCVCLTILISYLGSNRIIGVGIGTLLAMMGVGRIINFTNSHFDLTY